jgi:CRP-like cAMP-binding protein
MKNNTVLSENLVDKLTIEMNMTHSRVKEFLDYCTIKSHKRKEIIQQDNNLFDNLGYVLEGGVRTYYIDKDGNEISYLLQVNGDVIGDYSRFITGVKSNLNIQFILNTKVLYINRFDFEQLTQNNLFWTQYSKNLSDLAFLSAKQRLDDLFFYSPEERYLNLIKKSPEIIKKIPQKYISSFLGITSQSLSRIRRRIN